jgi:tetratricopeptide (TPR) repeat protein
MNGIELIRNKWFVLFCAVTFFGILWGSFQWIYRDQIVLRTLYNGGTLRDQHVALMLYRDVMQSGSSSRDPQSLSRLAEILVKTGRREEAIRIWEQLVGQRPEDRDLRFRLAVALHNQGKYLEAEKHFGVLLQGVKEHD